MPLTYEASDVYIEERDLSAEIQPPATSIGAQVFAARRGPVGRRRITTVDDYRATYGDPDASISFAGYTGIAFLNEASELWCNRVIGPGATYGGLVLQKRVAAPVDAVPVLREFTIGDPDDIDFSNIAGSTSLFESLMAVYCEGPGSYSGTREARIVSKNLIVPSNVQAADFSTVGVIIAGVPVVGSIQPGNYAYVVTAFNDVGETLASAVASVTIANVNTSAYISWNPVAGASGYKVYGRDTGPDGLLDVVGGGTLYYIDRGVITPGTEVPPLTVTTTDEFTLEIYDTEVSLANPVEAYVCSFTEKRDGFGNQLELEQAVNGYSKYVRVKNNARVFVAGTLPVVYTTPRLPLAAGASGAAVTSSHIASGWDEFRDSEKTDVRIMINAGYAMPSVQLKMDSIAAERGDAVSILDVPSNRQQFQSAIDYRNIDLNLNSNRSALYTPDLLIEDQYSGKTLFVPPSGHVAGVYAKTDRVAYPWFAPAGLNRALLNVLQVRYQYEKGQRNALWRAQVNYVRNFQGLGRAIWEQRTLQAIQSGFSFVNVRRMFDFLALSIKRSLYAKEFEPNDDTLRREVRLMIERFLETVLKARGINAYMVIVDHRNNPAFVTAQGQLNVDVFVEPTLPAEKIRVRMNLTRQDVNFTELLTNLSA